MRRSLIALFILTALCSCSREYDQHSLSSSPDGKYIIDITREIQAANDPDVYWQHISLRPATTPKPITPGNVAIYSCSSKPTITWKSNTQVELRINKGDTGSSFEKPSGKSRNGVLIEFIVE